nr:hypothetical protein [Robbsia betulipollinis]
MKRRLASQPPLDEWIDIQQDRAVGILEHGRFETRFTALLDLQRTGGDTSGTTAAHGHAAHPGWRAQSLAFDRTAVLVSSAALFASIGKTSLLLSLDRMTRALHAINFFASGREGLLFLPVHERLLNGVRHDHGRYFAAVLVALGIDAARVVIEIPRACATHAPFLDYLVRSYRGHGFKVAVNVSRPDGILAAPPSNLPDFMIAEMGSATDESRIPAWIASLDEAAARGATTRCRLIVDGVEDDTALARLRKHALRYAFAPAAR